MYSGTGLSLWAVPQLKRDVMCPPASAVIHGVRHCLLGIALGPWYAWG